MKSMVVIVALAGVTLSGVPCELLESLAGSEGAVTQSANAIECMHLSPTRPERPTERCSGCLCCTAVSVQPVAAPTVQSAPWQRRSQPAILRDLHPRDPIERVYHPPRSFA